MIAIPDKPKDGDVVVWWEQSGRSSLRQVKHTWYDNQAYESLEGRTEGRDYPPVVNEWWIQERTLDEGGLSPWRATGRNDTSNLRRILEEDKHRLFTTFAEAIAISIKYAEEDHRKALRDAARADRLRAWAVGVAAQPEPAP